MNCKYCGEYISLSYGKDINADLELKQACIHCHFWINFITDVRDNPEYNFVYKNNAYTACNKPGLLGSGFGGIAWKITFDDSHVLNTENLWHRGTIPKQFRDYLPDNVVSMKEVW